MKFSVRARPAGLLTLLGALAAPRASAQNLAALRDYWPTEGWRMATPEAQGMDPALPARVDDRVAAETPLLSALLVVRGGYIVFEGYYNGHQPDQPLHTWSVTKSVTDIAVGAALLDGVLEDLDQTVGRLVPERIPAEADPRVADITLRHLLTMTAGWEWDARTNFARHAETDDLDFVLTRPMYCDPGQCFEYDNGCPNLLSYIIQALTGSTMADYLQPRLFDPLGIALPAWLTTPQGWTRGAGGLDLTPRDMAKIGYLYLNQGRWDAVRLVGARWVGSSTREQSSGTSDRTGANIGYGAAYGYQWWVTEVAGNPAYFANGYGGQMIYVVPALDLIVVTGTAPIEADETDLQQRPMPIIEELIVPAALGG